MAKQKKLTTNQKTSRNLPKPDFMLESHPVYLVGYTPERKRKFIEKYKKEIKMDTKMKKQMKKMFKTHVDYLYTIQRFVETIKKNPLAFESYFVLKTCCPICGHRSIVSNMLNLDEFMCTNPECEFELSFEKIMKEAIEIKKEIENHV